MIGFDEDIPLDSPLQRLAEVVINVKGEAILVPAAAPSIPHPWQGHTL